MARRWPRAGVGDTGWADALGLQSRVDVTPQTVARFPALAAVGDLLGRGLQTRYFYPEELAFRVATEACTPAVVLVPVASDTPQSQIVPLSALDALDTLALQACGASDQPAAQRHDALARLLSRTACYRLSCGTDLRDLPALVDRILDLPPAVARSHTAPRRCYNAPRWRHGSRRVPTAPATRGK
jgi:hypothetical protein